MLCIVLSIGLAYGIKAVWLRADWQHRLPPDAPANATVAPFSLGAATQHRSFAAWDEYYLRALAIALALVTVSTLLAWYVITTCAQCGNSCCRKLRRRCMNPTGAQADDGPYGRLGAATAAYGGGGGGAQELDDLRRDVDALSSDEDTESGRSRSSSSSKRKKKKRVRS